MNLSEVTRIEIINHQDEPIGRVFTKKNCQKVELSLQDEGKTLKIFISKNKDKQQNQKTLEESKNFNELLKVKYIPPNRSFPPDDQRSM